MKSAGSKRRRLARYAAWPALVLPLGCGGSDRATATGTVKLKSGQPLVGARVIARAGASGKSAYGTTNQEGEFELGMAQVGDGLPPGDYTVTVVEDRGFDSPTPRLIADKYSRTETSGLTLSVKPGESAEIDLTLDPP